jgi:hypothetical protein
MNKLTQRVFRQLDVIYRAQVVGMFQTLKKNV